MGRLSLPPAARLSRAEDFGDVFAVRRPLRGRWLTLHRLSRPGSTTSRLGLVVAKRLCRTAVGRNLIRRIAREAFRTFRPCMPSADLVLRLAAPLPSKPPPELRRILRAEVDALLRQLK